MPFCTRCGHQAGEHDAFCASCGAPQSGADATAPPRPAPSQAAADPFAGLSPRTAAILCYVPGIGWIAAAIVLASRRFKEDRVIRFHAFQGLYLFAAWLINDWVIRPIVRATPGHFVPVDHLLDALLLFVSILMMVKASKDEAYVLPIIGELAQKSVIEH